MTKVKFFHSPNIYELEKEVNDFILDKDVVNVSYSPNTVGYSTWYYCCVLYREGH